MATLFSLLPGCPLIFLEKLNNPLLILASEKSIITPAVFKVGLSLYYWHNLPDVFE